MKKGHIYKIESPVGRIYIGKTTNIKNRFAQYRGLRCKSQPALYNSFISHGVDSHNFSIIGEFAIDELNQKEIFYIEFYNSMRNGLNCTIGGDGAFMVGDDNVSKREDVRLKMSKAKKEYYKSGAKHHMKGKKHTSDSISKIKEKRAHQESLGLAIRHQLLLDLETGIYYDSLKQASQLLCIPYKTFHYRVLYTKQSRFIKV